MFGPPTVGINNPAGPRLEDGPTASRPFFNPFQPGATNPFLTGQFAPDTFDPFAGLSGLLGRPVTADVGNNLLQADIPKPAGNVSPFRGGVGQRRGLLSGRAGPARLR